MMGSHNMMGDVFISTDTSEEPGNCILEELEAVQLGVGGTNIKRIIIVEVTGNKGMDKPFEDIPGEKDLTLDKRLN